MNCANRPSEVVLFKFENNQWVVVKSETATTTNGIQKATICKECVSVVRAKQSPNSLIGWLYPADSQMYQSILSKPDNFQTRFIHEGVVVIPMSEIPGALQFIHKLNIIISNKKLTERKNLQSLSDTIDQGKHRNNRDRKWKNIWGDTSCVMTTDRQQMEALKYVDYLGLGIEKFLFPEIFFGRKMLDLIRGHATFEKSLDCTKINLLVRFPRLMTTQHLHRDDEKFGLAAILVLKCKKNGYPFTYVVGSHELSHNGGIHAKLNIVRSDLTTIQVPQNSIICFSTNLVHAGGPASTDPELDINDDQPSDVSVEVDFSHLGCHKGSNKKSGYTITWPYVLVEEDIQGRDDVYKFQGDSPKFSTKMTEATTNWLNNYYRKRLRS